LNSVSRDIEILGIESDGALTNLDTGWRFSQNSVQRSFLTVWPQISTVAADGQQQQLDSFLSKIFYLTERRRVGFRADAFNTFNHPNFAAPDSIVDDAAEGQVTSTSVDNRRLQFALRYSL
jgi:hypothetical protein